MAIRYTSVTVTISGTTGSATTTQPIIGIVRAVHLNFSGSMASTADTTVATAGTLNPAMTLFVKSDSSTDAWFYPVLQNTGSTGAAVTDSYSPPVVADYITVSIAQGTTTETCIATILYEVI